MDWKVQEGAREDGSDAPFPGYSKRASLASSGLPLLGGTVPTFQSVAYLSLAVPTPCPPSAPQPALPELGCSHSLPPFCSPVCGLPELGCPLGSPRGHQASSPTG